MPSVAASYNYNSPKLQTWPTFYKYRQVKLHWNCHMDMNAILLNSSEHQYPKITICYLQKLKGRAFLLCIQANEFETPTAILFLKPLKLHLVSYHPSAKSIILLTVNRNYLFVITIHLFLSHLQSFESFRNKLNLNEYHVPAGSPVFWQCCGANFMSSFLASCCSSCNSAA